MDVSFNYDPNLGVNVCSRDKMVDGLRDQITEELITYMTTKISPVACGGEPHAGESRGGATLPSGVGWGSSPTRRVSF